MSTDCFSDMYTDFSYYQLATLFYMSIKGPFGRLLLQLCTLSLKQQKNKFLTLRRCGILIRRARSKVGMDTFQSAFTARVFVAYSSKCRCTRWRIHRTRRSHMCHDQQAFWQASANGHRCLWECKVKRRSI